MERVSLSVDFETANGTAAARQFARALLEAADAGEKVSESTDRAVSPAKITAWGAVAMAVRATSQALGGFVRGSLQAAIAQERMLAGLRATVGDAELAEKAFRRLQEVAKLPGLTFEGAVQGFTQLAAAGAGLEDSIQVIEQMGRALASAGAEASEINGVLMQIGQSITVNRLSMQDLRPIITRAPMVTEVLEQLYGSADPSSINARLQETGKSIADMWREVADGIRTSGLEIETTMALSLDNLQDSWEKTKASFGRGLLGAEASQQLADVADTLDRMGPAAEAAGRMINRRLAPALRSAGDALVVLENQSSSAMERLGALASVLDLAVMRPVFGHPWSLAMGALGNPLQQQTRAAATRVTTGPTVALSGMAERFRDMRGGDLLPNDSRGGAVGGGAGAAARTVGIGNQALYDAARGRGLDHVAALAVSNLGIPASRMTRGRHSGGTSADTHVSGASVDIGTRGMTASEIEATVREMRQLGFMAWYRPQSSRWPAHIHAVHAAGALSTRGELNQFNAYLRGGTGLAGGGRESIHPITAEEIAIAREMRENAAGIRERARAGELDLPGVSRTIGGAHRTREQEAERARREAEQEAERQRVEQIRAAGERAQRSQIEIETLRSQARIAGRLGDPERQAEFTAQIEPLMARYFAELRRAAELAEDQNALAAVELEERRHYMDKLDQRRQQQLALLEQEADLARAALAEAEFDGDPAGILAARRALATAQGDIAVEAGDAAGRRYADLDRRRAERDYLETLQAEQLAGLRLRAEEASLGVGIADLRGDTEGARQAQERHIATLRDYAQTLRAVAGQTGDLADHVAALRAEEELLRAERDRNRLSLGEELLGAGGNRQRIAEILHGRGGSVGFLAGGTRAAADSLDYIPMGDIDPSPFMPPGGGRGGPAIQDPAEAAQRIGYRLRHQLNGQLEVVAEGVVRGMLGGIA